MKGQGPVVEIDCGKLWSAINYRMYERGKKPVEIAKALGFSTQVFTNIKAAAGVIGPRERYPNYQPTGPIFMTLCWWLSADPRDFTKVVRSADGALLETVLRDAGEQS